MRIRERHPLRNQPIQIRSRDLAPFRIQCMNLTIAHVVREDEDNVGTWIRAASLNRMAWQNAEKSNAYHNDVVTIENVSHGVLLPFENADSLSKYGVNAAFVRLPATAVLADPKEEAYR